jgi:hypothetical protein
MFVSRAVYERVGEFRVPRPVIALIDAITVLRSPSCAKS